MSLIRARYRAVNTIMNLPRGGGYVGLLDLFPNAAAAYSLRKLRAAYSGAAVRVRESGGNTEADIGFTSAGELDTTALLAHCGANDGFVTVWYDQSLSNDATQTTAANQPKIVSTGSLVTENGKAAIDFDGVNDNFRTTLSQGGIFTAFTVHTVEDTSFPIILGSEDQGNRILIINSSLKSYYQYLSGVQTISTSNNSVTYGQQNLVSVQKNTSATDAFIYKNGILLAGASSTATDNTANIQIGAEDGGTPKFPFEGSMQEIIFYPTDQSANRTGIEGSINEYYNIY